MTSPTQTDPPSDSDAIADAELDGVSGGAAPKRVHPDDVPIVKTPRGGIVECTPVPLPTALAGPRDVD